MAAVRFGLAPLKAKRPPTGGTVKRAQNSISGSNDSHNSGPARILQWATDLDRLAHQESVFGHAAVAERLSQKAAELRESMA